MNGNSFTKRNWRNVKFGQVVRCINEASADPLADGFERYVSIADIEPDNLHIKTWGDIATEGTSFTRIFRAGQVLFAKRRAYQRKVALAEFDGICSGDLLVFEAIDGRLLPELLPFIVQSDGFFNHALATSAGSLSPRTKWKDLSGYEFPLPPLDEQRRIAEILWAVDEAEQSIALVLEQSSKLQQALLNEHFHPTILASKGYAPEMIPLADVASYISDGPFGSKLKTEHYAPDGAQVVRLQNIGEGVFLNEDRAFISLDYYKELTRYSLLPGDVVVAGLGDEAHPVGRACLVPPNLGPAINKADCFCLRAKETTCNQVYLMYFLNSPYAQLQIKGVAQGTTRLRVNTTNIQIILVPVIPLDQQYQVVAMLDTADQKHTELADHLGETRALKARLIAELLTQTSG